MKMEILCIGTRSVTALIRGNHYSIQTTTDKDGLAHVDPLDLRRVRDQVGMSRTEAADLECFITGTIGDYAAAERAKNATN